MGGQPRGIQWGRDMHRHAGASAKIGCLTQIAIEHLFLKSHNIRMVKLTDGLLDGSASTVELIPS